MSADPALIEATTNPWAARRRRADELRAGHPFSAEILTLYLALLPVQEDAWSTARERPPRPDELSGWATDRILPVVVEATVAAGPPALREAVRTRPVERDALAGWLAGAELEPVDRYLARASLSPVLEAIGEQAGAACAPERGEEGGPLCPRCGGLPQLGVLASSGESLTSGRRSLLCSRCGSTWSWSRSICPGCGETDEAQLVVYAEQWTRTVSGNGEAGGAGRAVFPHLRIAGCESCRRYLIELDMAREPRAVPEVDELAGVPLDLYAADQRLTKVTPNLMGF